MNSLLECYQDDALAARATAYHEAGHAALSRHFQYGLPPWGLSVEPYRPFRWVAHPPMFRLGELSEQVRPFWEWHYRAQCAILLAGCAAECQALDVDDGPFLSFDGLAAGEIIDQVIGEQDSSQARTDAYTRAWADARALVRELPTWTAIEALADALQAGRALDAPRVEALLDAPGLARATLPATNPGVTFHAVPILLRAPYFHDVLRTGVTLFESPNVRSEG